MIVVRLCFGADFVSVEHNVSDVTAVCALSAGGDDDDDISYDEEAQEPRRRRQRCDVIARRTVNE